MNRRPNRRCRDDGGVSLVFVALALVALIGVAALAIDGGQAYANRRQMQNGADAAAMAGTRAVDRLRFGGVTDGGTIYDAIDDARAQNGGSLVSCWLISSAKAPLSGDVCTSRTAMATAWANLASSGTKVAGVEVKQTGTKQTLLAPVLQISTLSASATAAATIQPFAGGTGAPFIICGDATKGGWDYLYSNGALKPSAQRYNGWIDLQSSQVPGCGAGASFKGKVDPTYTDIRLGVPVHADNGNGFDYDIAVQVANSNLAPCDGEPTESCSMVLPIANYGEGNGTNTIYLTPTAWGVFEVKPGQGGNPRYTGRLLGGAVVVGGVGSDGEFNDTDRDPVRLIKLVK